MPSFSSASRERLNTCHPDLQRLFNTVVENYDCTIMEGVRSLETQKEYLRTGKTRTLNSKHLRASDGYSHAVDVAPYPIDWDDRDRFYHFAGYVLGVADILGIEIRWGGDWDSDKELHDQTFYDLPHFELVNV